MSQSDYILIGGPRRYFDGHRNLSRNYMQRFRLRSDSPRKSRSVSLRTTDIAVARKRSVEYVEVRVQEILLKRDPKLRTKNSSVESVLREYIRFITNYGHTEKQASLVNTRIGLVLAQAKVEEFAEIDGVKTLNAIVELQRAGQFKTNSSANKYVEAMKAWSSWMYANDRWDRDILGKLKKIKGDTSNSRPRAILAMTLFEKLLESVHAQPDRRLLTGKQRYWLYLLAALTGFRAQELNSLTPSHFNLVDVEYPYVEIENTISKRGKKTGKKDRALIRTEIVPELLIWLNSYDNDEQLWGSSRSWWYKAAEILRADLNAAEIPDRITPKEGIAVIDFHSFRGLLVTNAVRTGMPTRTVMQVARLSSESLLKRYTKISELEVQNCVDSLPMPKLKRASVKDSRKTA